MSALGPPVPLFLKFLDLLLLWCKCKRTERLWRKVNGRLQLLSIDHDTSFLMELIAISVLYCFNFREEDSSAFVHAEDQARENLVLFLHHLWYGATGTRTPTVLTWNGPSSKRAIEVVVRSSAEENLEQRLTNKGSGKPTYQPRFSFSGSLQWDTSTSSSR